MKNKAHKPTISVFMPVYNAVAYVEKAINSIQRQTFTDWEMVIVDDLSTDGTFKLIQKIAQEDKRIRVYRNGRHRGVAGAANLALPMLQGQYIARMDADDISLPDRFEQQVTYFRNNPDTIALGGQCFLIDKDGNITGKKRFPTSAGKTQETMFYRIPVQQPAMMINRALLPKDFVWYEEGLKTAEEVELLFKLFKYGKVKNLKNYILQYRIHGNNVSLQKPKETFYLTFKTRLISVFKYGYRPTFKGIIVTLSQLIAVTILPQSLIFPVYSFVYSSKRALKKYQSRIYFSPSFNFAFTRE